MKICLDNIIFALQPMGGISVYWHELLKRMLSDAPDLTFIERPEGAAHPLRRELPIAPRATRIEPRLPLRLSRYLPVRLGPEPGSVFHSSYYRVAARRDVVNIVTVHDFIYERFYRGMPRYVHQLQKGFAIARADGIICVSENTRQDLLSFYPDTDVTTVTVIPQGVSEEYRPVAGAERRSLPVAVGPDRFALFLGKRVHYKNFTLAAQAVRRLGSCALVIVGGEPLSPEELGLLEQLLPGKYRHLTGVDDRLLNLLYNEAFCLLYPSSYEGFGIPVLEAMRAGCPVVALNGSSIPEVGGDGVLLVERPEADDFASALRRLEDGETRQALAERGLEQAGKFSWDRTYRETLRFYEQTWERKFGTAPGSLKGT